MSLLHLIKTRKSVRKFKPDKVSKELILQLLEAVRWAPSAVNRQPWRFIVVDAPELIQKVQESYPREWFKSVHQVIIVCGNHEESWKREIDNKDYCDIDVAIATDHLTLKATELGLGTCWVCNFNPDTIRHSFQLPESWEPIVLVPFGFPLEDDSLSPIEKNRKKLEELVHFNTIH